MDNLYVGQVNVVLEFYPNIHFSNFNILLVQKPTLIYVRIFSARDYVWLGIYPHPHPARVVQTQFKSLLSLEITVFLKVLPIVY